MRTRVGTRLLVATTTALLISLTACSSGSDGEPTATADGADMMQEAGGAAGGGAGGDAGGDADGGDAAEAPAESASSRQGAVKNAVDLVTQQAVIKSGAVALRSDDVGQTRFDIQVLMDEHGGQVADDATETDKSGAALRSRMVLRVPVDGFGEVMEALARMDTLVSTSTSSEDVTTQLIDVEARIKVQRASVDRVRQLLARAASIRDIMAIESEVARRQADLDSLAQQRAYLEDQTSMSTVKVNVERTPDAKATGPAKDDDDGFLAGLSAGWSGLETTVVAVATVVGALLPFAGVALLVGVPVWLLVRRLRRTTASTVPVPAAPAD